ncbi:hypothetical protein EMPG_14213 [Blastomyces silverae]|uniref:Uncharacterized protein n=1 Tax=Blastomyces silverae TaxID=2060906 RepID=A0A0H1BGF0_9EURO|nr:hypothetical protein EMPG_14213 [Blastomyces silverae]
MTFNRIYTLPAVERHQRPPLLRLSRELRDIIYTFTLIEPRKWARRHNAFCPFSQRNGDLPETAPFVTYSTLCRCARRRAVGLLLANRQINTEASPIFWRENIFTFDTAETFVANVGHGMADKDRNLIRHVIITEPLRGITIQHQPCVSIVHEAWKHLRACRNLRTLKVDCSMIVSSAYILNLPSTHNFLESFTLCQLSRFAKVSNRRHGSMKGVLVAEISQELSLELRQQEEVVAAARTEFGRLTARAINSLEFTSIVPVGWFPRYYIVSASLDQATCDHRFAYANGAEMVIPIYGLRNSKATSMAHARERRFHETSCKMHGLPTMQEARAVRLAKEARKKRDHESRRRYEAAVEKYGVEMRWRKRPRRIEADPGIIDRCVKRQMKAQERSRTLRRTAERSRKRIALTHGSDGIWK